MVNESICSHLWHVAPILVLGNTLSVQRLIFICLAITLPPTHTGSVQEVPHVLFHSKEGASGDGASLVKKTDSEPARRREGNQFFPAAETFWPYLDLLTNLRRSSHLRDWGDTVFVFSDQQSKGQPEKVASWHISNKGHLFHPSGLQVKN